MTDQTPARGPAEGAGAEPERSDPTSRPARGELRQAEVRPLDVSGIPSVIVGIVAWAIAFVVVLLFRDDLERDGEGWWLWVTVAGFGLGLVGLWYCRRRLAAIQAGHRPAQED